MTVAVTASIHTQDTLFQMALVVHGITVVVLATTHLVIAKALALLAIKATKRLTVIVLAVTKVAVVMATNTHQLMAKVRAAALA